MVEVDKEWRVLVTRAGTGSSNNLIRGLRAAAADLTVIGCHSDRFHLRRSQADRNYLIPTLDHPDLANALRFVAAKERVGLIIPTTDDDVRTVSGLRASLPCRVFLPAPATVALCQDKYALAASLEARGVPVPRTFAISQLEEIEDLFARLAPAPRVWCRIRTGTGSLGATAVRSVEQARSWIKYWTDMRGIAVTDFTLSEYLPGRDFACQSLWKDGRVVLLKTTERVSYFGGAGGPSGVSSIGGIHKTVREPAVVDVCVEAVQAIDGTATGAFSIDLKADRQGRPCVTEINVGRFLTGSPIFDLTGKHNMTGTYVRLALDQPVQIDEPYDVAEDYYMIRDLDTLPEILHADELSEGIEDARLATANNRAGG
jgi:glutathione synthase/RimK-type ligase-like ATP-grasp enzyme